MKATKREKIFYLLIALLLFMGVGYAYLTTDLNIMGTSLIKGAKWDVHWENAQLLPESIEPDLGPTIDVNKTKVSYTVTLEEPGDMFAFTVDAKNGGTIDAMIENIALTLNDEEVYLSSLPPYLYYHVVYDDFSEISYDQLLPAGEKLTYRVYLMYRTDIDEGDLPTEDLTFKVGINIKYGQAGSNAYPINEYSYTSSNQDINFGDNLESLTDTYNSHDEVISATGYNVFLRHMLVDNTVQKSDIGFKHNNKIHYLYACSPTDYSWEACFNGNKQELINIFGTENCGKYGITTKSSSVYAIFECHTSNDEWVASILSNGGIGISNTVNTNNRWECFSRLGNYAYCEKSIPNE